MVAVLAQALDDAEGTGAAADYEDLLLLWLGARGALDVRAALACLNGGFVAGDVDGAVAFCDLEEGE